jgi:SAM-dependent methyltransferase
MRAVLTNLDSVRELIARRLIQNYPAITEPELNCAILYTILRVHFLQIGQNQGLAGPGTLAWLSERDGIDQRLTQSCIDAGLDPDIFFDTGNFGFRSLPAIPDEVLRAVISITESMDVPGPAITLPIDERAIVFDYYLGTTMRIAEGYRVKREGKSSVKYTGSVNPIHQPVVDKMVQQTLRRLQEGRDTRDRMALHILDPACGAGIFLLAIFQYFAKEKLGGYGAHRDSASAYQEILGRSVFGIDIDPEAVAVARFILLSAYIEKIRCHRSIPVSVAEIRQVVACLVTTIRCGNALIAPDYFSGKQEHPFNLNERRKVNPLDWHEVFPEIMESGGFDAVIGAPPPYRPFSVQARDEYFQMHYDSYAKGIGLYGYFIEQGIHLLRDGGTLAFCIPDTFLSAHSARSLRRLLLKHQILEIADAGRSRILQGAATKMLIFRISKSPVTRPFTISRMDTGAARSFTRSPIVRLHQFMIDQRTLGDGGWVLEDRRARDLMEKIWRNGTPLNDYVMGQIEHGTISIRNNPFIIDTARRDGFIRKDPQCRNLFQPVLRSADMQRYFPGPLNRFLIAAENTRELQRCRVVWKYLQAVTSMVQTESGLGADTIPAEREHGPIGSQVPVLKLPKIIFAPVQKLPAFSYDPEGLYAVSASLFFIPQNDLFLVAILNSTIGHFFIASICERTEKGYHVSPARLGRFPIYTPDFDNLADKTRHEKIVALVTQMLSLHEYLQRAKTDQEKRLVLQEIDATDVRIDALVYDLYGLDEEEITVVESAIPTVKSPS